MSAPEAGGTVYVVVLNWNGWRDTLACLETVLRSDYPRFQVVVCDNASSDGSMGRLVGWAEGRELAPAVSEALAPLATPALAKPVPHAVLTRGEAERGGADACSGARVVFVETGANLGYAGGCNVGIRYALARGDCSHVWLLNNDTVVPPDALAELVARLDAPPGAGLCGSRLLYYDEPQRVQGWGGARYNRWLGITRRLGDGERADAQPDVAAVERATSYVYGASALASRRFLDAVGVMAEDYFLYFEELDWAVRGRAFARRYAHRSVVYHREGRSIGSSSDWRRKSVLSDYYTLRNRLRVTRRFFPWALPAVYCGVVGALLNRLYRRQFRRAMMVAAILGGRSTPPVPAAPRRGEQPAAPGADLAPR